MLLRKNGGDDWRGFVATSRHVPARRRPPPCRSPCTIKFSSRPAFFPVSLAERPYSVPAQFRTCLWLRAGRWISGQEAGKTPFVWEGRQPAGLAEYGPAAGGEPAAPPEAGDAAQSNDGAGFFGLGRSSKDWLPKRLVHLAGRAVGISLPNDGVSHLKRPASGGINVRRRSTVGSAGSRH